MASDCFFNLPFTEHEKIKIKKKKVFIRVDWHVVTLNLFYCSLSWALSLKLPTSMFKLFTPISFCGKCIGSSVFWYYRQPVCSVLKNLFCEAYQKTRTRYPGPGANDPSPETWDPGRICGTRDLRLLRGTQDLGPSTWDSF